MVMVELIKASTSPIEAHFLDVLAQLLVLIKLLELIRILACLLSSDQEKGNLSIWAAATDRSNLLLID
ncbi:hypothetical protein L1987_29565 [Smallanthus sonchifolius]|uniref:Uncharacterized protein n=1 Tax=Smallanthus sonchifolius TaxID=185202 RepID=A0ACB9I1S8_9ASTR|nr:hypothetical protein L1987_29565 [Smallanthus sonchifolius]